MTADGVWQCHAVTDSCVWLWLLPKGYRDTGEWLNRTHWLRINSSRVEVYHNNGVCTPSLTFVRKGVTIKRKTHGHGGVFVHLKTEDMLDRAALRCICSGQGGWVIDERDNKKTHTHPNTSAICLPLVRVPSITIVTCRGSVWSGC